MVRNTHHGRQLSTPVRRTTMKNLHLQSLATKFRKPLSTICLVAATAGLPIAAHAGNFTDMFIFGDSLSDTGNLQVMTTQLHQLNYFPFPYPTNPQTPYYQGRFSNGSLWVEDLAEEMGLPAVNTAASGFSLGPLFGNYFVPAADGHNYAVAG